MAKLPNRVNQRLGFRPELLGGLGRALSSRDYRFYASGHLVHVHGWWTNRVAISWLTWELTQSPLWLGIVTFANMIPVMLVAPIGGAFADRYGHRLTAVIAGGSGSTITFAIAILTVSGQMTLTLLLVLSAVQGAIFGMEFPARQALIPQLVGRANISAAIGFNAVVFQIGTVFGPLIGGFLISRFSTGIALFVFGFTSIWMAAMISLIRHHAISAEAGKPSAILADIGAGFRYLAGHQSLRLLFTVSFVTGILIRPYPEFFAAFSADIFGRGADGYATLAAATGIGALPTAVYLAFRGRTQGLTTIMVTSIVVTCLCLLAFTATTNFNIALVAVVLAAMMFLAAQVGWQSLIQNTVDPAMRGRIISINASIGIGAPAIGGPILGALAEAIGLRLALAITTAIALVVVVLSIPNLRRRRAQMEAAPTE